MSKVKPSHRSKVEGLRAASEQNQDLSSTGGERPVVKMKAGSEMQMPDATAPNCNSLLHITLSVNYVTSLQAVIRAGCP